MKSTSRLAIPLALVALLTAASGAEASWKESHRDGLGALAAGRFEDAAEHFRAAIAERSKAADTMFVTYLPHYHLGVALAELGDCRGALASFEESKRQGAVAKDAERINDLERRAQACRDQLDRLANAIEAARGALANAETAAGDVETMARGSQFQKFWERGDPTLASLQEEALESLRQARAKLAQGEEREDMALLSEAQAGALEASRAFADVEDEAKSRLGQAVAAKRDVLDEVEDLERSARVVLRSIGDLAPYPPGLGRRVRAVESALAEIEKSKTDASPPKLKELNDRLIEALAPLRTAAAPPPQELVTAAESFLEGDYELVLEALAEVTYGKARARGHACLLRSASRWSLWVLGGESDEAQLEEAQRELEPCFELEERPEPLEKFFSPRYLEFYRASLERLAAAEPNPESETEPEPES